jgi:CO/xanthine dehydrogenase Mo-binding subunit
MTGAYCAVVAEIEGAENIRVRKLTLAVDVGEAINPDGVINQIEGGIVQAASWTLFEAVSFDATRVTSRDWGGYPILRFPQVPEIVYDLIDRPNEKPWGAGEPAAAVVPCAISNAVFDSIGVRLRSVPYTPEKVLAAMKGSA